MAAGSVALAWDARLSRWEGAALVGLYVGYIAIIWAAERRPPTLGETAEVEEAREGRPRVRRDGGPHG